MFISSKEKEEINHKLICLELSLRRLDELIERHEVTISALLKVATNKAKQDSSVTVTVHAPYGLRKDGTPRAKPGPKKGDFS
jgi:hypothetical protein